MNKTALMAITICSLAFSNEKTPVYVTDIDNSNNSIDDVHLIVLKKQIVHRIAQSEQYQVSGLYEDNYVVTTEIIETDDYLVLSLELYDVENNIVVNSTINHFEDFDSIDRYISTVVGNLITGEVVRVNYGTTRHMGDLEKSFRYLVGAGFGAFGVEFGK